MQGHRSTVHQSSGVDIQHSQTAFNYRVKTKIKFTNICEIMTLLQSFSTYIEAFRAQLNSTCSVQGSSIPSAEPTPDTQRVLPPETPVTRINTPRRQSRSAWQACSRPATPLPSGMHAPHQFGSRLSLRHLTPCHAHVRSRSPRTQS